MVNQRTSSQVNRITSILFYISCSYCKMSSHAHRCLRNRAGKRCSSHLLQLQLLVQHAKYPLQETAQLIQISLLHSRMACQVERPLPCSKVKPCSHCRSHQQMLEKFNTWRHQASAWHTLLCGRCLCLEIPAELGLISTGAKTWRITSSTVT